MKMTIRTLRSVIERALKHNVYMQLSEAADDDSDTMLGDDAAKGVKPSLGSSIDAQIDHYLIEYEKSAGKKKEKYTEVWNRNDRVHARDMTRSFLLGEAKDDEDEDENAEDKEAQLPADVGDSQDNGALDIESFASSVARLVENFDSLVETKHTVVKRAEDFLRKSHSDDDVQHFLDSIRDQHNIDFDESVYDKEASVIAPPAAGAGVSGAGA